MIFLSLKDLKAIAKSRDIKCYENKSAKDLLKLFNDSNIKIGISKKKLKEIEKNFKELRHNFSKKEIDKFRKSFYNIKNHGNIYTSKIKEAEKNLSELEKSIQSIKSSNNNNESIVDIRRLFKSKKTSNIDYNNESIDDIRRLFDYFKPKKTDEGFAGRRNNYIEYISEGDNNKNLSPEEYLEIIRPYLNDLINHHKASGEWKIQLVILNRCISSKNYEETRYMYSARNNIEIFMGSNTNEVIDRLFNTMLQSFQEAKETSFERGSKFIFENVDSLYYYFQEININRSGSYIYSPECLKNKKVTINPNIQTIYNTPFLMLFYNEKIVSQEILI